jgi:hypothetical protein
MSQRGIATCDYEQILKVIGEILFYDIETMFAPSENLCHRKGRVLQVMVPFSNTFPNLFGFFW